MLSNALTYAKASVMCALKERINKIKKHTHRPRVGSTVGRVANER